MYSKQNLYFCGFSGGIVCIECACFKTSFASDSTNDDGGVIIPWHIFNYIQ